jgi:CMP-N,N'-diacetyllegionaminic acid synthase
MAGTYCNTAQPLQQGVSPVQSSTAKPADHRRTLPQSQWVGSIVVVPVRSIRDSPWDRGARLGLIPARGGSLGVPGKNIRLLAGVPLLVHSIRSAQLSGLFDDVYVSTDDVATSEIASAYGAKVISRPPELASPETPMPPVVEHAIEWYRCDRGSSPHHIFLLQPTSPFRTAADILHACSLLYERDCNAVMGVFEADDPPQWGLRADCNGMLRPATDWTQYLSRRQDLTVTYLDGPLYAIETTAFLAQKRFLTDKTRFFVVPRLRAIDIDTELDFLFAEFLLERSNEIDIIARSRE